MADVLPSPEVPELDLDSLKAEIRQEVTALRSDGRRLFPDQSGDIRPLASAQTSAFDGRPVRSMIALASSFADPGERVPPMHRFRGVVRRLARLTARLILALTRFMTDRQRNFNHLTTRSLDNLADGLERTTSGLAEQVHALQELTRRQEERIAALEAALDSCAQRVQPKGSDNRPTSPEA